MELSDCGDPEFFVLGDFAAQAGDLTALLEVLLTELVQDEAIALELDLGAFEPLFQVFHGAWTS